MGDSLRIAPVSDEETTPDVAELLRQSRNPDAIAVNVFATLAKHPGLFRRWIPFASKLLVAGKLPARDRELAIMRTAYLCGAAYEWGQHWLISRAVGISAEELDAVARGPEDEMWSSHDGAVLRAADELRADAVVSDETWAALAATYDEAQLIELLMLIGSYTAVAYFLRSAGVESEPGLPPFPETA